MWGAFGNGSSGFVSKAQGWEFVPCSRSERGGKKVQSPRVRSFPSNLLEPFPPGPAAASDTTSYNELKSQHMRLKKRFEELKKRHDQEREAWRMEKETLFRHFADIQGGENRRILLDLRSVLEEVQSEVKREESKRSELELRYIKDRCAWQLERAELMSRITQLEVRGCSVPVEAIRRPEQGDTLKREREEQKRLLADTHSAAMDLRCRLDSSEKDWVKEKSELLERFDSERKEWENQLMDMQRKLEELYDEVKAQCKGVSVKPVTDLQSSTLRISSCSASTLSSDAQSNDYSEVLTQQSNTSIESPNQPHHISSESVHNQCNINQNDLLNLHGAEKYELGAQQAIDTAELEDILESCLKLKRANKSCFIGQDDLLNPFQGFQSMEINCGSDKKKNTALNAALKEIARVSEELCSYQDEMRKWPDFKRSCTESMYFPEEDEMVGMVKDSLEMEDTTLDLKNLSEELKSLDEQYWMNWEGFKQEGQPTQNVAKLLANKAHCAPPIPARSTSWYLSSPSLLESSGTEREFQGPGFHQDRKYNSPAIVRKFEAMLQENEGKILMDSGNITCTEPVDSKCNINCYQSRWSCNGNRFGSIKSSKYAPVKKCLSNIDIATAATECSLNPVDAEEKNDPKAASHPMNLDHMSTDSVTSLDIVSPYSNVTTNRRNERLEQKTAELNRTLFQAGIGHRCNEDCELASTPSLTVFKSKDSFTDRASECVEDKMKDLMAQYPEDKYLEMNPHTPPQLKSETKSSSLQHDVGVTELPLLSSDHASKDLSSLKADFIYPTKHRKEVKPLWTEHSTAMPVVQSGLSFGGKCFEMNLTPLQMNIPKESFTKNMEVGTDQPSKQPKQAKQDTRSRILEDNPWKPSTLAAYPRPVESRSNYGAVERILKSYEDQNRSQDQQQSQPSPGKEKDLMDLLEMLDIQHEPRSSQRLTHTPHHQVLAHKETHVRVQVSTAHIPTQRQTSFKPQKHTRIPALNTFKNLLNNSVGEVYDVEV